MLRAKRILAIVVTLGLLAPALHADRAQAAEAFKLAQRYQAAKQWGNAVKAYKASLAADSKYVYAYKGLGTTYYQAGDQKGALAYYERYLAANPSDTQTRAFADRLRAELGGGASPVASNQREQVTVSSATKSPLEGWSLGAGVGILMAGADDLNVVLGTAATKKFEGSMALGFDLGADYGMPNGFVIGAKLGLGPNRSHLLDFSSNGATSKFTADIGNLLIGLSPGYRIPVGESGWMEGRLGLGMLMTTMTITSTFTGGSLSSKYTGSGFAIWPEFGYVHKFNPNFGGSASLGYMISSVSPLIDDKGNEYTYTKAGTTTKEQLGLSTGGLSLRLGLLYFL